MSFYPTKIAEKFHAPQNSGTAAAANAVGANAAFECGAALRFTLRIDRETGEIREAKYKTSGCGGAIAAAEVLVEKIVGKHLAELHGLDESVLRREIESELGAFENKRKHCLKLAFDALQTAFADFRRRQIEEWTGEKTLVCTCFGVSEETIEKLVENEALETVEQVTARCNAGGGCGACQPLIEDILDVHQRERLDYF